VLRVLPIRYSEILAASDLIAEYAAECCIPDAQPQPEMYAAMEESGALKCFGAYLGKDLVGFVSTLISVMPHHGKRLATIESLFAAKKYRIYGTGDVLMDTAEAFAAASGCVSLVYTARLDSALEKILSRRRGCVRSHAMFTRWL
jgi:GNAT superfamily N-acetyltransferase